MLLKNLPTKRTPSAPWLEGKTGGIAWNGANLATPEPAANVVVWVEQVVVGEFVGPVVGLVAWVGTITQPSPVVWVLPTLIE